MIFKKSDVEDLREKLQEACDHPEMVMKMKNQAADFICEKYNWDQQIINGSMTVRRSGIEMLCLMQSGMVTAKALPRK